MSFVEGYVMNEVHRSRVQHAAKIRAETTYQKVKVNGVIYPNLTQASKATGLSARTIKRYAQTPGTTMAAFVQ